MPPRCLALGCLQEVMVPSLSVFETEWLQASQSVNDSRLLLCRTRPWSMLERCPRAPSATHMRSSWEGAGMLSQTRVTGRARAAA